MTCPRNYCQIVRELTFADFKKFVVWMQHAFQKHTVNPNVHILLHPNFIAAYLLLTFREKSRIESEHIQVECYTGTHLKLLLVEVIYRLHGTCQEDRYSITPFREKSERELKYTNVQKNRVWMFKKETYFDFFFSEVVKFLMFDVLITSFSRIFRRGL